MRAAGPRRAVSHGPSNAGRGASCRAISDVRVGKGIVGGRPVPFAVPLAQETGTSRWTAATQRERRAAPRPAAPWL